MIHSWGDHIGKRTDWSLIYFLIYAYLNILACRKFSLSVSKTRLKVAFFSESAISFSNLQISPKNILGLKFKIPAQNSSMFLAGILNFKLRIVFLEIGRFEKVIRTCWIKATFFLKRAYCPNNYAVTQSIQELLQIMWQLAWKKRCPWPYILPCGWKWAQIRNYAIFQAVHSGYGLLCSTLLCDAFQKVTR